MPCKEPIGAAGPIVQGNDNNGELGHSVYLYSIMDSGAIFHRAHYIH